MVDVKKNTEIIPLNTEDSSSIRDSLVCDTTKSASKHKRHGKRSRESNSDSTSSSDSDGSDSSPHRKKQKLSKKKKKKLSKKKKKLKKGKRSRRHRNSSSSSGSDDTERKHKERKLKKKCKKKSSDKDKKPHSLKDVNTECGDTDKCSFGPAVPDDIIAKSRAMAPISKEEWEKQQSVVKRVFDEDSGRYRLVKGDGEIMEECVSRERHHQINKSATAADGVFFQNQLSKK